MFLFYGYSLLPPANKVCEGNVFTPVCHSVHSGGVCLRACWDTQPPAADTPLPGKQTPPRSRHPPEQTPPGSRHPTGKQTPLPLRSACYWNVYLLLLCLFHFTAINSEYSWCTIKSEEDRSILSRTDRNHNTKCVCFLFYGSLLLL